MAVLVYKEELDFFLLNSCCKAELINHETLFYKETHNWRDTKHFSLHDSVQVTPILSL